MLPWSMMRDTVRLFSASPSGDWPGGDWLIMPDSGDRLGGFLVHTAAHRRGRAT